MRRGVATWSRRSRWRLLPSAPTGSSSRCTRSQRRRSATVRRHCERRTSPPTQRRSNRPRSWPARRSAPSDGPGASSLNVAVLGVGLIGGSIGLATRRRADAQVCGYDPDDRVRAKALELGAIDRAAGDIAEAVRDADVVFVATPVGALAETVLAALAAAGPECVISDVGSTKRV